MQESSGISLYTESKINPCRIKESQLAGNKSSQAEKLIERILKKEADSKSRLNKLGTKEVQIKKIINPNS